MNVFMYCQHLSGTGHYVRTHQLATRLAEKHQVAVTSGGRIVPRKLTGKDPVLVKLPGVYRDSNGIAPLEKGVDINDVWDERRCILFEYIEKMKPDILTIEHFPFSKHELAHEIIPLIAKVRASNPSAKVVCSIRDIIVHTNNDPEPAAQAVYTLDTLQNYFDAVLVHSDPELVKLESFLPWFRDIQLPVNYTGYVSEIPQHSPASNQQKGKYAVVSVGGNDRLSIIKLCIELWKNPDFSDVANEIGLMIFLPLNVSYEEIEDLSLDIKDTDITIRNFSADFIDLLSGAEFSISQAGYNTCANLLQTQTKGILVPDTTMSDQLHRAKIFKKQGLAEVTVAHGLTIKILSERLRKVVGEPAPRHEINLNGDVQTMLLLEKLFA